MTHDNLRSKTWKFLPQRVAQVLTAQGHLANRAGFVWSPSMAFVQSSAEADAPDCEGFQWGGTESWNPSISSLAKRCQFNP